ncbi:MAG: S8 family serine peptidase [Xanthomonadales bacterium]|nr:S8 family serine peptidase [Xanthomonadales bacterium]
MRFRSGVLVLAVAVAIAFVLHADPVGAGQLRLATGDVDTDGLTRSSAEVEAESRVSHLIVQFDRASTADVRAALARSGAAIEAYVPDAAFRVRRNGVSGDALRAIPGVTWVGHWRSEWKLAPALRAATPGTRFDVYGHVDGDLDALLAAIAKLAPTARIEIHGSDRLPRATIALSVDANAMLDALARADAISWIAPHAAPEPHNTEASGAIQSGIVGTHPLWARGLTGHGQVVAVADSGLDANERWFTRYDPGSGALVFVTPAQDTTPPAPGSLVSNAKVIANWVQPGATAYETLAPCGTVEAIQHGTHVSGSVAGDSGVTATPLLAHADAGDGMAPNAQLLFQDIGADCLVVADYAATLLQARAGGAHIHSNSWGAPTGNSYTGYDFDADDTTWALQDLLLVASAGNRADAIAAIGSPGNAKNALTVGALLHGASECAASLHTTAGVWGTSIGPGSGWRDKPEISAPGVATISAAGDDFSFGAEEPAESKALSGTSMATPTVAGGAALMRQYFAEGRYPHGSVSAGDRLHLLAPTLKAAVVNSTGEILNSFIGETRLPSYISGWGRMYLDRDLYFPGDSRRQRVFERSHGSGLATGEVHEYAIENVASGQSLRATLAWFDVASIPGVDYPLVNDLDLEVVGPGGELYRGNAFGDDTSCQTQACYDPCEATLPQRPVNSTISIANVGSRDSRNNLEAIRLLAPTPGRYVFRVRGFSVPGNDRVGSDRQGYGLVVAGAFGLPAAPPAAAPQNPAVTQNDSSGIRVEFDAVVGATAYQLYRAIGSCAAADIADFHLAGVATGASVLDPNTIGGDTYAYRVRAIGNDVEGTASACIEAVSNDDCTLPPLFDREAPVADAAAASCRVALSWNPAPARCALSSAVEYTVQRSLTPDFAAFASFIASSANYLDTSVANGVPYFYRVLARDSFGNESLPSAIRNATPVGAGGPAGLGFIDDADTRTHAELETPWQFASGLVADGSYAYKTGASAAVYPRNTCASVTLPALTLPDDATLRYDARFQLETGWDGVVVEISTDDGATWSDLPPSGGYPGSFEATGSPPINACGYPSTRGAFSGDNGAFQTYASSLAAYAGQRVRIRWRLSTDPGIELQGFHLDAIRIDSPRLPLPPDLILRAGFDNDDAAAVGMSCAAP